MRTYSEFSKLETLDDRFDYLSLTADVGKATFGYDRWINQTFYRSKQWRNIRNYVIIRDDGNDMGIYGLPIAGSPHIHHMNPVTLEDMENLTDNLLDPEYLICVSRRTHNAIHFGDHTQLPRDPIVREPGDTSLW
jgi:hypothetical protein